MVADSAIHLAEARCWLHFAGNQLNFSVHVAAVTDIKSLHLDELRGIAEPSYRADQIAHWLYQKRVNSFAEMTDLPQALRTKLADDFSFDNIDTLRVLGSKDTTQKFLFRLRDGNLIESVLIPASPALYGSPSDRRTICISTQVGCAYRLQILRKRAGWLETKSACG